MKTRGNIQSIYQKKDFQMTSLFLINRRIRKTALCYYERFLQIHVWSYTKLQKKTFLSLLFTVQQKYWGHVNDCFKINSNQMTKMPEKAEYNWFKNYETKIKSICDLLFALILKVY